MTEPQAIDDRLAGILLGTAVGDSLGLPADGLSPPASPAVDARAMAGVDTMTFVVFSSAAR